jgi:hypothetical protein
MTAFMSNVIRKTPGPAGYLDSSGTASRLVLIYDLR